jgi:hypothetical protein
MNLRFVMSKTARSCGSDVFLKASTQRPAILP